MAGEGEMLLCRRDEDRGLIPEMRNCLPAPAFEHPLHSHPPLPLPHAPAVQGHLVALQM